MTYSPFDGKALRDIEERVDEAKHQSAMLIEQSQKMLDGTTRLIEQSKKLLFRVKAQKEVD